MKLYVPLIFSLALAITGCSTTMKPRSIDSTTGQFPTTSKLSADSVKATKPFVEKFKTLAYVKTDGSKAKQYNDFFVESLKNMGVFTKVVTKQELESLVLERKLTDKVSNISDLIGLNQLEKQMGPFLVVEPYVEWKGGYNFFAHLKAIDPASGETVLLLEQNAFNWTGLDDPLFFPLMNGFLRWTQGKPIATAPKQ
jgi:hypothetical protein